MPIDMIDFEKSSLRSRGSWSALKRITEKYRSQLFKSSLQIIWLPYGLVS